MSEIQWRYIAEDQQGKIIRSEMLGTSPEDVQTKLASDGMIALKIEHTSKNARFLNILEPDTKKLTQSDYAAICRGLTDLTQTGISIADALSLLIKRQKKPALKQFLQAQLEAIRAGQDFSKSLHLSPYNVPNLMTALVSAGEQSGALSDQLNIIAETLEKSVALRKDLTAQMIYPIALLSMLFLTLIFLSFFVLPQFENIFTSASAQPPPETQFILASGAWIRAYGAYLPLIILLGILLYSFVKRRYERELSHLFCTLPITNRWGQIIEATRYCRSLGAMLTGGTALAQALPIARKAISSPAIGSRFENAIELIRSGTPLTRSFSTSKLGTHDIIALTEIGEQSGQLGPMLLKAADLCENDLKTMLTRITTLAGPVLTALMGIITAIVIASVMSGVLSLNDAIY